MTDGTKFSEHGAPLGADGRPEYDARHSAITGRMVVFAVLAVLVAGGIITAYIVQKTPPAKAHTEQN